MKKVLNFLLAVVISIMVIALCGLFVVGGIKLFVVGMVESCVMLTIFGLIFFVCGTILTSKFCSVMFS